MGYVADVAQVVRVRVPAKVNLALCVGSADDTGYHELGTVFQALSLWDEVSVEPAPAGVFRVAFRGEGAAFLPANGSSSLFIDRISAGDDSIQSMAFHSLPSLEEKPYQMTLTLEYEDAAANAYQAQETVSVQVKQGIRADTSAPQVMPEMVQVGQDASVTFNIHNQGKTKLYNAKAAVKDGQPVTGQEMFIGTIEAGSTGAVDMLVHADEESTDPLVIEVTYEDVNGKVTSLSKEVPLSVMPMEKMEEYPEEGMPMEESVGLPILPILVGLFLLALLVVVLLLVRRSRRRSREREDMEHLSLTDDDPLVPADFPQA